MQINKTGYSNCWEHSEAFMVKVNKTQRLPIADYKERCSRVRERDRWQCQLCGAREQLEVHHIIFRSRGGDDSLENLITVCRSCHEMAHRQPGAFKILNRK